MQRCNGVPPRNQTSSLNACRRYKKRRAEGMDTPSHGYDSSGPFSDGAYAGETGERTWVSLARPV